MFCTNASFLIQSGKYLRLQQVSRVNIRKKFIHLYEIGSSNVMVELCQKCKYVASM